MNEAQMQARKQAIDYMVRLLQMNPIQQGEEIILSRTNALKLEKHAPVAQPATSEALRADRRLLLEQLEAIRDQFWAMPIEQLTERLAGLQGQGFGDLEAAISRLRVVAAERARFPQLIGKPGFDGEFFSALKEVLIRSPRDTAVLREKVLSSFRNRQRRKTGRKMVTLLKTEMPAIYDLEADWMNSLYRQKSPLPFLRSNAIRRTSSRPVGSSGSWRGYLWVPWVLIAVIRGLVSFSEMDSNRHSTTSTVPNSPSSAPQIYSPGNPSLPGVASPDYRNGTQQGFSNPGARSSSDPNQGSRDLRVMPKGFEPPGNSNVNRVPNSSFGTPHVVPIPGAPPSNGRFR